MAAVGWAVRVRDIAGRHALLRREELGRVRGIGRRAAISRLLQLDQLCPYLCARDAGLSEYRERKGSGGRE